ncbi:MULTISPECIES: hypothetical protein [Clostridium]|uniref:Uncharacterized protein n=2 Tax=Clostridium TaxID=1485 RepID=A0A9Q1UXH0_CLOBO|nr:MULTISPECIES: hypothetical protein [Clostridium]AEB75871.1 hypothetical protein CbC4_1191 [Clostridium botulinum BKT015925]KEH97187.1 hypothetical protein Z953_02505 [Clostridium botulinum D str. 16868]KEI04703.1 hypothetical protein Y848_00645 [Clostridium botulinum C/D str. Sp77]KEI16957.1 hypothetical protein Z959_08160 [Clostridium novyi B str. ATCC 27606]KLU76927.1 hypothetical protein CBC3_01080 [Clostridium botulinum V891]
MYLENLVALHIAIEKHYTPEMAFKYLDKILDGEVKPKIRREWSSKEIEDIKKFKSEGLSFSKIGEIYCTTASNIFKVLDYRKKSCANSSIKSI